MSIGSDLNADINNRKTNIQQCRFGEDVMDVGKALIEINEGTMNTSPENKRTNDVSIPKLTSIKKLANVNVPSPNLIGVKKIDDNMINVQMEGDDIVVPGKELINDLVDGGDLKEKLVQEKDDNNKVVVEKEEHEGQA